MFFDKLRDGQVWRVAVGGLCMAGQCGLHERCQTKSGLRLGSCSFAEVFYTLLVVGWSTWRAITSICCSCTQGVGTGLVWFGLVVLNRISREVYHRAKCSDCIVCGWWANVDFDLINASSRLWLNLCFMIF